MLHLVDPKQLLLTKLKWVLIDTNIALKNKEGSLVNFLNGQRYALKFVLYEVYGLGHDESEAIATRLRHDLTNAT